MGSPRGCDGRDAPRVAIAHDYLTQRGGAEKVVLAMSRAFPDAPIHTMLYEPSSTYPEFASKDIRVSALNRIGFARRHHRATLPILPLVAQSMFVDADVVLTSSSGWAHGFRTSGRKLIFCHTPAHWLSCPEQYLGTQGGATAKRLGLKLTSPYMKVWDRRAALSADRYLAVSTFIRQRINDTYGIDADVVFPPAALLSARDVPEPVDAVVPWLDSGYYLCVSRFLPYKNVDAVVRAVADRRRRLVVVGEGPEAERLRALKTDNVILLSRLSDGQMAWLYKNCRALIAASYEDFGLTPIEAGVWGKPTVALRYGGFLDTVDEGATGVYFDRPEPELIVAALNRFEKTVVDPDKISRHVEQFTERVFAEKLHEAVDSLARH